MDYENQLSEAIDYAVKTGSFSKINMAEQAEIVCAYGAGNYFNEAFEQWEFRSKMHVNMLCDSDQSKWGKTFLGLRCCPPEELFEMNSKKRMLVIVFINDPFGKKHLQEELKKNNITYVQASDCIFEMICNMERSVEWFCQNNILEVLRWLEDEKSRHVYSDILCNRIAPHLSQYDYSELYSEGEYFATDAFKMCMEGGKDEYYVDCGAYNGDTIKRLLDFTEGEIGHIYAFEMDKGNYAKLQQNVRQYMNQYQLMSETFDMYNAGVWDHNGRLPYGKEACGSKESFCLFKKEVVDYAELVKIDDLLEGKKVSLIKMDIEGAEYRALNGAKELIIRNTPKMAICLYHRLQDFWEIPTFIKSLVSQYKLYVRHHGVGIGGTVLYAVKRD